MKKRKNKSAFLILITFIFSFQVAATKAQVNKVAGFYADNFYAYGFFATFIQLNPDSTFKYEWGGDMEDDRAIGTYKIINDTVFLTYLPSKYDTSYYIKDTLYSTIGSSDSGRLHLFVINHPAVIKKYTISYHIDHRPSKFYYRHKKLLCVYDGSIVHKIQDNSAHRMFLLFGKHYKRMRKCYMVRHGNKGKIFEEW